MILLIWAHLDFQLLPEAIRLIRPKLCEAYYVHVTCTNRFEGETGDAMTSWSLSDGNLLLEEPICRVPRSLQLLLLEFLTVVNSSRRPERFDRVLMWDFPKVSVLNGPETDSTWLHSRTRTRMETMHPDLFWEESEPMRLDVVLMTQKTNTEGSAVF
jgi:hypothetical protein